MDSHLGFLCTEGVGGGGGVSCRVRPRDKHPDIFKDIYKILRYCQRRREKLPLRLGKGFKCACLPVLFGTMSL